MGLLWLGLLVILLFHLPQLSRLQKGERIAFAFMWTLAAVYSTLVVADVYLPNITEIIVSTITSLYQWLSIG